MRYLYSFTTRSSIPIFFNLFFVHQIRSERYSIVIYLFNFVGRGQVNIRIPADVCVIGACLCMRV